MEKYIIAVTDSLVKPKAANYLYDRIERKDSLFPYLSRIYLSQRECFCAIARAIIKNFKHYDKESAFAALGYISYIKGDYLKAKKLLLKAINCNSLNLDNWIDFAFVLRHTGDYEVSNCIIFNLEHFIHYYKMLGLAGCPYSQIRLLAKKINMKTRANS